MAGLVGGREYPRNWHELQTFFPDDGSCRRDLAKLRWPAEFRRPDRACGHDHHWLRGDGMFLCCACRQKWPPTAGTGFDRTRTPLRSWFVAAWYVTNQAGL